MNMAIQFDKTDRISTVDIDYAKQLVEHALGDGEDVLIRMVGDTFIVVRGHATVMEA